MTSIKRKLAAILAADVYQFSKMMGDDEPGTLANLQACRQIIDDIIAEHSGRIFGTAGDSVVAEFASAVSAVLCAVECQRAIAQRNALPGITPLQFRIGVNIGDVIVEGDNLYGDGINVAARLESVARPGSICVSAKVYDEVRRKLSDISFIDGGARKLKNIEDPVSIYHIGPHHEAMPVKTMVDAEHSEKPLVAISPIHVISGGDRAREFAEGLSDTVRSAVARSSALSVTTGEQTGADFSLKGSVHVAGEKVRLVFALEDARARQVWTERYDRRLDDAFDLQDEIVLRIAAAIRFEVKAQIFERVRHTNSSLLSVPELLNKAAGLFIRTLDQEGEAVSALRRAVELSPESSMAWAMLGYALLRVADYRASLLSAESCDEIVATLDRALTLDSRSYFARSIKAVVLHDLLGDVQGAREQASEALEINGNFIAAKAMLAIVEIHLGDVHQGLRQLQDVLAASPQDASALRHRRELAIAHLLAGNAAEGVRVATRLWQEFPVMKRNALVLAGLQAAAGDSEGARCQVQMVKSSTPCLSVQNARLPRFGDVTAGERFRSLLMDAGL
jgi:class 3 adenylate cyclase/TolB-like protein